MLERRRPCQSAAAVPAPGRARSCGPAGGGRLGAAAVEATPATEAVHPEAGGTQFRSDVRPTRRRAHVDRASGCGILPLGVGSATDPLAKDPFADDAAVPAMYDAGGIASARSRLPGTRSERRRKNLGYPIRPTCRRLDHFRAARYEIEAFEYLAGAACAARRGLPTRACRRPADYASRGGRIDLHRRPGAPRPRTCRTWMGPGASVASCRGALQPRLGIGCRWRAGRSSSTPGGSASTANRSTQRAEQRRDRHRPERVPTPPLTKPGKGASYCCRIHPFMRGSIRLKADRWPTRPVLAPARVSTGGPDHGRGGRRRALERKAMPDDGSRSDPDRAVGQRRAPATWTPSSPTTPTTW